MLQEAARYHDQARALYQSLADMSSGSKREGLQAADAVALVISYVVNPMLIPAVTAGLLLYLVRADTSQSIVALAFIGTAFCLVPIADVLRMVTGGIATSFDLPERADRSGPLSLAAIAGAIGFVLYQLIATGIDLVAVLAATYIVNLLIVLAINAYWKISIHSVAIAGMLSVTLYLLGPVFGLSAPYEAALVSTLAVLVPLVMWARVQLRLHTPAQVLVGALLGFVGHWAGFYYLTPLLVL